MSSSTPTKFLDSQKQNLKDASKVNGIKESDYLLSEIPVDRSIEGAKGINTIFDHFPYAIHTFQYINPNKTKGKTFVKTFDDRKAALDYSLNLNIKGYNVYFMVNEGSGITPPDKHIPRCKEAVISLSNCYIDTDNCPLTTITNYLDSISLTPHLTIETSPGRHHLYFHFDPVEASKPNVFRWEAIQQILARLGDPSVSDPTKTYGIDKTMHDYSKILRVPGFYHVGKNHLVTVKEENDLPPYTLDDLFKLTEAQQFLDYNKQEFGSPVGPAYTPNLDLNQPKIISPARFETLQSLSMWLANETDKSEGEKFDIFNNFVVKVIDNSDKVYAVGNTLTRKSLDLFDSANKKKHREETTKVEIVQQSLIHKDDPAPSPWQLPDEFYLRAPGGLGDIVRQVMSHSKYPCAPLAFGTFLSGLSILRSRTHFTPSNSSCALYILNVAISGYGKNDPRAMLQNTFRKHGLSRFVINEIRSDRGLYNDLGPNDSTGIIIMDEIAPFLRAVQKKDASTHIANLSRLFLSLYTSGGIGTIKLGKLASSNSAKGEKEMCLENPMLAICGFTTPDQFNDMFTESSILGGLFQRFIPIVADIRRKPANREVDAQATIESPLFADAQIESLGASEMDSEGKPIEGIQAASKPARTRMRWASGVRDRFYAFEDTYRDKLIETALDPDLAATSGLYSRIAEQVERMATVLAQEEITQGVLDYCIEFMESRHKAMMSVVETTILRGEGSKYSELEDRIVRAIGKICSKEEAAGARQRDIHQAVKRFMKYDDCVKIIKNLYEQGRIVKCPIQKNDRYKSPRWGLGEIIGE